MRLSQLIAELQRIAQETGDQDPHVFGPLDDHHVRPAVMGMEMKRLNVFGSDMDRGWPGDVEALELQMKHASWDPDFDYLWKAHETVADGATKCGRCGRTGQIVGPYAELPTGWALRTERPGGGSIVDMLQPVTIAICQDCQAKETH